MNARKIRAVVKWIPIVGNLLRNKDSEDSGQGNFSWYKLATDVLEIGATVLLTRLLG